MLSNVSYDSKILNKCEKKFTCIKISHSWTSYAIKIK